MPRYAMGLEYDGTDFIGWQSQAHGRSVQDVLCAAVSTVADQLVEVQAAGRTDAGVHARGQVAHFDSQAKREPRQWRLGINSNLPDDLAVAWVKPVADDFDARRSALSRRYRYSILHGRSRPALLRRVVWWMREELDLAAMTRAAVSCLGERDFSAFRAAHCQSRTPMRRMIAVGIARTGALTSIDFTANAFLYHMVRNLVGALVEVGRGKQAPSWIGELLMGHDRKRAAATAPASGLTLVEVRYPERFGLPVPKRLQFAL